MNNETSHTGSTSSIKIAVWIIAGLVAIMTVIVLANAFAAEQDKADRSQELIRELDQQKDQFSNDLYREMTRGNK